MTVNFNISPGDRELVKAIVARASLVSLAVVGQDIDRLTLEMDLAACHANGTPLDLERLHAADQSNFIHDVWGVSRHMDRSTGKLTGCFLPRFAVHQPDYESEDAPRNETPEWRELVEEDRREKDAERLRRRALRRGFVT